MGVGLIRSVFEYWRPILGLGDKRLTTDQARRTFCTLGNKYTGPYKNYLLSGALQAARPAADGSDAPPMP